MKYINIISLIVFLLVISSCQNNEFEKKNDAVFKSIKKVYTLNTDGSINYQYQHTLKYITHFSFNRAYGESFIVYNPEQQELTINKAETKMADGKIVPSPENAFNEVLPRFAAGAPAFNNLREMVVTHTGLEPECVVDFNYELSSKAGYLPFFTENIILQENVPVENLEIVIIVPDETALNYKLINIENMAKISKNEGHSQYTWKFKNLNGIEHEANQPHDQSFLPRLIFSNVNMPDILNQIHKSADLNLNDQIKAFITKKISGRKKGIQIIKELQNIVGKEMNTFNVPIEHTTFTVRPISEVWKSNGGTELEKILLLNEIIKYSGFESKVILDIAQKIYDGKVGNLKDFGHYFIQVNIDGEDIIISTNPKPNNLVFNLSNDILLDLNANLVNLPDFASDLESSFMAAGNFKINNSGDFSGKLNCIVQGAKNPYLNYIHNTENAKKVPSSMFRVDKITDFNIITFDKLQSEIETNIEDKKIWKNQGNYYFVEIPTSNYGIKGEHLKALLSERHTPLKLNEIINESYDFTISIPEDFSLVTPIIEKEISNNIGFVKIKINSSENQIHMIKSLKINKQEINPNEYNDFKSLINLWNKKTSNELILKKSITE